MSFVCYVVPSLDLTPPGMGYTPPGSVCHLRQAISDGPAGGPDLSRCIPLPGAQSESDVSLLRAAQTAFRINMPGTNPDVLGVLVAEGFPAGVGNGTASDIGRSRQAWRILLAIAETDVIHRRLGPAAGSRRDTLCERLGRGDLIAPTIVCAESIPGLC